jgi:3-hydroxyacyl-[acyl-carrier-protein] dehydratase
MAAKPLLDMDFLTSQDVVLGIEEIRRFNPQRYEMEHLTAILYLDKEKRIAAGYKNVTDQEFWVRGHLPDRPLLPGVIMLEAGAQMSSVLYHSLVEQPVFFGFAALNDVRFRGPVVPGQRLYLIAQCLDLRPRRGYFQTQGIAGGKVVFEAKVLGMPM